MGKIDKIKYADFTNIEIHWSHKMFYGKGKILISGGTVEGDYYVMDYFEANLIIDLSMFKVKETNEKIKKDKTFVKIKLSQINKIAYYNWNSKLL